MSPDTIYLVTGKRQVAGTTEVDTLEQAFGAPFPQGYRDFVTRLGDGYLDELISIYPPTRILGSVDAFREAWAACYRWPEGQELLPQSRLLECIPLGETNYQDTIIFHPDQPESCYVLPGERLSIYFGPDEGLSGTIRWILESGVLVQKPPRFVEYSALGSPTEVEFHCFESPVDRRSVEMFGQPPDSYDVASAKCIEVFSRLVSSRILYSGGIRADLGFWVYESASASKIHCERDEDGGAHLLITYDSQADASLMEKFIKSLERVGFSTYRH
jgi:hypothetical protein